MDYSHGLIFIYFGMQPIGMKDLNKVNPFKACEYYNSCFKDPSTFTLVIVGNIDPAVAQPLILQYLVSRIHCVGLFFKSSNN